MSNVHGLYCRQSLYRQIDGNSEGIAINSSILMTYLIQDYLSCMGYFFIFFDNLLPTHGQKTLFHGHDIGFTGKKHELADKNTSTPHNNLYSHHQVKQYISNANRFR